MSLAFTRIVKQLKEDICLDYCTKVQTKTVFHNNNQFTKEKKKKKQEFNESGIYSHCQATKRGHLPRLLHKSPNKNRNN